MTQFTYKTDNGLYNVKLLEDQAKIAFNYLAEVETEVQTLSKRIDVLKAAAKSFHEVVQENLIDSALIDEKAEEEKQES